MMIFLHTPLEESFIPEAYFTEFKRYAVMYNVNSTLTRIEKAYDNPGEDTSRVISDLCENLLLEFSAHDFSCD